MPGAESHTKVSSQYFRIGLYFADRALVHDMAVVDDVGALCKRKRRGEVLLYQDYGLARINKLAANLHEVTHNHRRQAFEL